MRNLLLLALFVLTFVTNMNAQVDLTRIDIVRDKWGVPHIFAPTDEEVSYGLAWATAEDDFKTMQELLLSVKGLLGSVNGKDGAILDFMYQAVDVEEIVEQKYDAVLSPKFKKILEYYALAVNSYAEQNPAEVLHKKLFPVTGKDLMKSYTMTMTLLTNVHIDIQKILGGHLGSYGMPLPDGSNAFAFNSNKTKDGKTYLAVNSHQPLEGLFSWYEAHVCSEEGWNMLGGTFPGGAAIYLGTNEHLGWANTLNHPDLVDVYQLEMNPKNKLQYRFDGEWLTLEERVVKLKVKVGFLKIPVKKKLYKSVYGTTLKGKDGNFYSMRYPANMDIMAPQQLYRMNKAKSYEEFVEIMGMQHQAGINTVMADRKDNIFFLSNGQFPYRDPNYDWFNVLPGDTSATLWEANKWHPLEEVLQIHNPSSGYLYNTNNTPFHASGDEDDIDPSDIEPTMGYLWEDNNRSIRAKKLIDSYDKIDYEDFKTIKYDTKWDKDMYSYGIEGLDLFLKLDPIKYPDLKDAIEVIQAWNFDTNVENEEVTLLMFAVYEVVEKVTSTARQYDCNEFFEADYVEALRAAKKHMLKHFGSLRVPLGDVQKHVRGDVELPISGSPDVIAATIAQPYKKGMLKTFVGDSYIMLIKYSADSVEIETVHAYGASTHLDSPHSTDQMQMFVDKELKPMTLNKDKIYAEAESIYHPGGEPKSEATANNK